MAGEIRSELTNLVGPSGVEVSENKTLVKIYLMRLIGNTWLKVQKERRGCGDSF